MSKTSSNLSELARTFLIALPRGTEIPVPRVEIEDHLTSKNLGVTQATVDRSSGDLLDIKIVIQKRVLAHKQTLDRVMAHEICHVWEYWKTLVWKEHNKSLMGHSKASLWYKGMTILNQKFGKDFITEKADSSYREGTTRPYYVIVRNIGTTESPNYAWCWFSRITPNLREWMDGYLHLTKCAFLVLTDPAFLTPNGKPPYMAIPKDPARKAKLEEWYKNYAKYHHLSDPSKVNQAISEAVKIASLDLKTKKASWEPLKRMISKEMEQLFGSVSLLDPQLSYIIPSFEKKFLEKTLEYIDKNSNIAKQPDFVPKVRKTLSDIFKAGRNQKLIDENWKKLVFLLKNHQFTASEQP